MGTGPAQDRPQEGRSGYPEEGPPGVADDAQEPSEDKPQRQAGKAERKHSGTGNEDEGTATGNPHAAGS
ncbi:MAG TPA: hypothetical protein VH276_05220 [Solirubrobacteraceae bacterium]|jgi:hypothetical protein|nr:hypothetical protein [Solirubrobacteraceae bacterium]